MSRDSFAEGEDAMVTTTYMIHPVQSERLPDFIVIGTMKSGSTALFNWLGTHPSVQLPRTKEPNFFSDEEKFKKGIRSYSSLFRDAPPHVLTGEASVSYTDPLLARKAAARAAASVPDARLICILRDPIERLKSHYRHEVQRGRERREFFRATSDPASDYVRRSLYSHALEPWVTAFPPKQLRVLTYERFFAQEQEWLRLLSFLSLDPVERPTSSHNVTSSKAPFSALMRRLWDAGLIRRLPPLPASVRHMGKRLLLRSPEDVAELMASVGTPVDREVERILHRDTAALRAVLPDLEPEWALSRGWQ